MSYLELAKRIQAELKPAGDCEPKTAITDPTEREIVAVLIDSEVLGARIWFGLHDDWKPNPCDAASVFYASELPFLRAKSPETLREIFKVKTAVGGGTVRQ
jgi:hypothetical protein